MPLNRRHMLAVGAGFLAAAHAAASRADTVGRPQGDVIRFKVFRGGAAIGEHRVSFHDSPDGLEVQTDVAMAVGLGPLTLFRYSHHARERWTSGRFESLDAHSDYNGRLQTVQAQRMADGVRVQPAEGPAYQAAADALPLTHWNRQIMTAPLFNPQDGKLLHERGMALGPDTIRLADGRSVAATRYSLAGETQIDDWYDQAGVWTALRGKVKDGSVLNYQRVDA